MKTQSKPLGIMVKTDQAIATMALSSKPMGVMTASSKPTAQMVTNTQDD